MQLHPPTAGELYSNGQSLDETQKHALVEVMPSGVFTCDSEGLITYYNQRAAELWGRYPELRDPEDRYCGSFRIFRPDGSLLPHDECPMAVAVHTGRSTRNEEIQILRPDGTTIIALVNIDPLLDANGKIIGAINVLEDITRRKQTEEALRVSEERLRLATEAGAIGIFDYDLQSRRSYFSPLYRAITKIDSDPATMNEWLARVHPEDRERVQNASRKTIESGETYHYEYRIFWPDGSIRWVEVHGMVEHNSDGVATRLTGAMRDVTERKQVEDRLHTLYRLRREVNRNSALEPIFEQALLSLERVLRVDRCAILLAGVEGVMHFQASHNLSEEYRRQVDGHSPWASGESQPTPVLIADVAKANDLGALQQIILTEGIRSIAFIPIVEQGKLLGKFMLYYDQPYIFPDSEVRWSENLARDIAHAIHRKQVEDELRRLNATLEQRVSERTVELERSNRELDQFAYVASHDLKAPLRGISQLASWISADAASILPESSKEHLAKLHGRVHRMDMLLSDLLAYSRAGRQRHTPEEVDTALLIQDVVEILTPPPGFTISTPGKLPVLVGERVPLEAVFRNLIGNAIKHHHNPANGRVEITAQRSGEYVLFTVADDGPGIEPRFHQRIFEMFQTLQPRDQIEGSGIGLALVKKLVESRGGSVEIESNLGQGASFRFTWPITPTS